MQTNIHQDLANRADVVEAEEILRSCVHCGFCTATCPTYRLTGDELDSPRGRIYLIKNLLETGEITARAAQHLDRCLTCRSCETSCPSGVTYGRLLDVGRTIREEKGSKARLRRLAPWVLRQVLPRRSLIAGFLALGQLLRPLLPAPLKRRLPPRDDDIPRPAEPTEPDLLLLGGCVQSVATPGVNRAIAQLLAINGSRAKLVEIGCCGALDHHLAARKSGEEHMKKVIRACASVPDAPIVSSATGCGLTLKEYGDIFRHDANHQAEAASFSRRVVDVSELFEAVSFDCRPLSVAVHTPCSMQHGMRLVGGIEEILRNSGFEVLATGEGHLCCGSAGTYSILQPRMAKRLLANKIEALSEPEPDVIVTANIGCQLHLGSGTDIPVMHWAQLLYRQLRRKQGSAEAP